jgi:hypothetical protein
MTMPWWLEIWCLQWMYGVVEMHDDLLEPVHWWDPQSVDGVLSFHRYTFYQHHPSKLTAHTIGLLSGAPSIGSQFHSIYAPLPKLSTLVCSQFHSIYGPSPKLNTLVYWAMPFQEGSFPLWCKKWHNTYKYQINMSAFTIHTIVDHWYPWFFLVKSFC